MIGACSIEGCDKVGRLARGWCRAHHERWRRYGDPLGGGPRRRQGAARAWFNDLIARGGWPESCIDWPFARTARKGRPGWDYGQMFVDGRVRYAGHLVLEAMGQPRPSDAHEMLHSCDRPCCVNPRHLRWGTHAENMQDMVDRQRKRRGTNGVGRTDNDA